MRYFVPHLRLGIISPPETSFADRFGGLPWGLPEKLWPVCPDCNRPYALLLQIQHHPERLDLGQTGRRLYVFQCPEWPDECSSILDNGAAIILEKEQCTEILSPAPSRLRKWFTAIRIMGWDQKDDLVTPDLFERLQYDDDAYLHMSDDIDQSIAWNEKVGGAPRWGHGPLLGPGRGWRFLIQFSDSPEVEGPIPTANQIGGRVIDYSVETPKNVPPPQESPTDEKAEQSVWALIRKRNGDHSRYAVSLGNFGMGHAYIFSRNLETSNPEAYFHWQRY